LELFHFSEEEGIAVFAPRPVAIASPRSAGMEWLNGPLVWAIEERRQVLYLFPRDCPRVLVWPTAATTAEDLRALWPGDRRRMIAYMEYSWLERLSRAVLYRYAVPSEGFEDLNDAGMWVCRTAVTPSGVRRIADLPAALKTANVELRVVDNLEPLEALKRTSFHVSAIRLRNMAVG
jgi:hypothetical protein